MAPTKWGIAGSGNISFDFVNALSMLDSSIHKVVAIAARSQASAETLANKFDVPKAYEGYGKLAQDNHVDIVHVGTINPGHLDIVRTMLNAGKHVLCEKPLGMNVKETKGMIELAREKKVKVKTKRFLDYSIFNFFGTKCQFKNI